nr:MAG TPA: hypothetical protein [Caudoviricetes sp.]
MLELLVLCSKLKHNLLRIKPNRRNLSIKQNFTS